jgi:hypothetical protein
MVFGYEVAVTTLAPATATAYANFWVPAGRRLRLREIGVSNSSSTVTAPQLQLVRASARGTQTTTTTPTAASNAQDVADAAPTALIDTAWSVQPTLVSATLPMRMTDIAGTVGSGQIWNWQLDGEITVGGGTGLVVQNASGGTGPVVRIYFLWLE